MWLKITLHIEISMQNMKEGDSRIKKERRWRLNIKKRGDVKILKRIQLEDV